MFLSLFFFLLNPESLKRCCLFVFGFVEANAVLEEAYERVIVGDLYCDIPLGLYIIRGENVVLIGELVNFYTKQTNLSCFLIRRLNRVLCALRTLKKKNFLLK